MGFPKKCGERRDWERWSAAQAAVVWRKLPGLLLRVPPLAPCRSNWQSGRLSTTWYGPIAIAIYFLMGPQYSLPSYG
jgi:hypothetical protein